MAELRSQFLNKLKRLEGGYVNHPNDKGGPTKYGVTLSTFKQYFGSDKTVNDLINITDSQYRTVVYDFYSKCGALYIKDVYVAELVAQFAYNAGISRAVRFLQRVVGVTQDGKFGPITLNAVNKLNPRTVHSQLKLTMTSYYKALGVGSQSVFLKGWLNRLSHFNYGD